MSSLLKGKSLEEAADITNDFFGMMKGEEVEDTDRLEDAIAYQGVAKFPARIKCATLAWKALEAGIKENNE